MPQLHSMSDMRRLPTGEDAKCKHRSDNQTQYLSKVKKKKTMGPDIPSTRTRAYCVDQSRGFTDCVVAKVKKGRKWLVWCVGVRPCI